jgi:predicted permease
MMEKFPMPPGLSKAMIQDAKVGPNVRPLKDEVVGDVGNVLWVLMGTAGMVLLIACANVANLFLVRAEGRQQELAIRAALDAGWDRIARELLSETIGLGLLGGVLGLGLAYAGLRLLIFLAPSNLPRLGEITIDLPVLLFTLAISVLAGILFGLIPVFKYGGRYLAGALKEGGRALSEGRQHHRARNVLVVSQVALSLVLLVSAGLMIRTFQALRHVDPGFVHPEEILTLRISIPGEKLNPDQIAAMHQRIMERIEQVPGVVSVGLSSNITLDGNQSSDPIFVEDRPLPEGQIPPLRRHKSISSNYFKTMGDPILAGRDLTWADIYGKTTRVLISESLAREYWKTPAEAIGRRIRETPTAPWREIIGVAGNERDNGVNKPPPPTVYWPIIINDFWKFGRQARRTLGYAIRSPRTGTPAFLNGIRAAVWSVNPNVPLANVRTLQRIYERSMARTSFTLVMLGIASAMAMLLGLVGIYGVISYSVSQRTREIGIRMALGAQHGELRRLFLGHGLVLVFIGVAVGLGTAAALSRVMSTMLFGVSAVDPATYAGVSILLIGAALLASYLPARRATGVDPVRALRAE